MGNKMNKQELLEWVQSMPDNVQILLLSVDENVSEKIGTPNFLGFNGAIYSAEYEQNYENRLTVSLHYKTTVRYEYSDNKTANRRVIK